jgi:hypothetical protein
MHSSRRGPRIPWDATISVKRIEGSFPVIENEPDGAGSGDVVKSSTEQAEYSFMRSR